MKSRILKNKKVYLEVYGCQMNEYDSELVKAILSKAGYGFVHDELAADIIMLNTCAIREHAHRKIYGRVHEIHHKRRVEGIADSGEVRIGILGCMATNLRTELFENRGLRIDFIAGPDSYKRLPQLIEEALVDTRHKTQEKRKKIFDVTLSEFETYSDVYPMREAGVNAWIAVMRGCNNFCTFCVVPYTRGRERSRAVDNITEEAKRLADSGFKQVTLLGQNVNSYRHGDDDFADLMEAVSNVEGIERIRFTSPHPKDFPDRFLDVMADNPKICKHIHLPLQSGNDRILELMNRTYTQDEFLALVDKIREKIPGIALSTDVIAGFCTETDEEFEDTLDVMSKVHFDSAFTFKYSQRKNTMAERKMADDVPDQAKTERIMRLNDLQRKVSYMKNKEHVGQTLELLVETVGLSKSPDESLGRADNNKLVKIPKNEHRVGDKVTALITGATPHNLRGKVAVHAA